MLLRLAQEYGELTPSTQGDFLILCPFHSESRPSCRVNDARFKCFACGKGGDAITWLRELRGMSFKEAHEIVKGSTPVLRVARRASSTVNYDEKYLGIINTLTDYISQLELIKLEAISRRLPSYVIEKYNLRGHFADPHVVDSDIAVSAGIGLRLPSGDFYYRCKNRLIIPIYNQHGILVSMCGRDLSNNPEAIRYLDSPSTQTFTKKRCLFGLDKCIRDFTPGQDKVSELYITEGFFDAMTLSEHHDAVALMGCNASNEQINLITHYAKDVVIALDNDEAGHNASFKLAEQLLKSGLTRVKIWWLYDAKDWNEDFTSGGHCQNVETTIFNKQVSFNRLKITMSNKKNWDTTLLYSMSQRLVDKNITDGYPHFNCVDYAIVVYPEFTEEIQLARDAMLENTKRNEATGKDELQKDYINKLLLAWAKPCKKVRMENEQKKDQ